jgi:hypothetical protein
MENIQGRADGWDVHVLASDMADAIALATEENPVWRDAGVTVRWLPTLRRETAKNTAPIADEKQDNSL